MDSPDISIVFCEDSNNWHTYLKECFSQIPEAEDNQLLINSFMLEEQEFPMQCQDLESLTNSCVQLVIISPSFLEFINKNGHVFEVGRLLNPNKIVAMLCGVQGSDITESHKEALVSYDKWSNILTVLDKDKEFVINVLQRTADILSRTCQHSSRINQSNGAKFKITPSRIREGNNKLYIILEKPLTRKNDIKVYLQYTANDEPWQDVFVRVCNPYTLKIKLAEELTKISSSINIHVYCDTKDLGYRNVSCLSKMGELAHILHRVTSSPLNFMCQALGLNPKNPEEIDIHLSNSLKRYDFDFGNLNILNLHLDRHLQNQQSGEEIPTFLHFAAEYGLDRLCSLLLSCPGAANACHILNINEETPLEIAQRRGHNQIVNLLGDFLTYCQLSNGYDDDATKADKACGGEPEEYRCCINERKSNEESNDQTESVEYVEMTGSKRNIPDYMEPHKKMLLGIKHSITMEDDIKTLDILQDLDDKMNKANKEESSNRNMLSNSQCELIEIINDFKEKNLTIQEVDLMFQNWMQKQKLSDKSREDKLMRLRQNYESTQLKNQLENKNTTTMEKCKQFFSAMLRRNKTSELGSNMEISSPIINKPTEKVEIKKVNSLWRLSTTSSSSLTSVDRLSCWSHDSGNHSDAYVDEVIPKKSIRMEHERLSRKLAIKKKQSMALLDPQYLKRVSLNKGPTLPRRNDVSNTQGVYDRLSFNAEQNKEENDLESFGYVMPDVITSQSIYDNSEKPPIPIRSVKFHTNQLGGHKSVFYDQVFQPATASPTDNCVHDDYIEMNNEIQPIKKIKCNEDNAELLRNVSYISMNFQSNHKTYVNMNNDTIPPPLPPPREESGSKPILPPRTSTNKPKYLPSKIVFEQSC